MDALFGTLKAIFSLSIVLGLICILAYLLKRYGMQHRLLGRAHQRLKLIDSLALDTRRRLVLIERDHVQHLILLGSQSDLLVESGILKPKAGEITPLSLATKNKSTKKPSTST